MDCGWSTAESVHRPTRKPAHCADGVTRRRRRRRRWSPPRASRSPTSSRRMPASATRARFQINLQFKRNELIRAASTLPVLVPGRTSARSLQYPLFLRRCSHPLQHLIAHPLSPPRRHGAHITLTTHLARHGRPDSVPAAKYSKYSPPAVV